MSALPHHLTIGELAARGPACRPSAMRYYEGRGLVAAARTPGNQRRYAARRPCGGWRSSGRPSGSA